MPEEKKPKRSLIWWFVVMALCYGGTKVACTTMAHQMASSQQTRELEKNLPPPVSEQEYRTALDTLDSNIAGRQAEIEEWYRLNSSTPDVDIQDKLLPDKNFAFRGVTFGMTVDEVKAQESNRPDTVLSPAPPVRPGYETYWYYITDGVFGILQYAFDSTRCLNSITITLMGPPLSEAEAISTMKMMEPIFNSAFGIPVKYSDLTYGWLTPKLNCIVFSWATNLSVDSIATEMIISYTPPGPISDKEISILRKEMVNNEKMSMEAFGQVIQ
jgi:hypothetical protein